MKGLKPFPLIGLGIIACAIMSGCAGHAPQSGPGALNISNFSLQNGVVNVQYRQVLLASGGVQPYTWTLTTGTLPPGLSLASNGVISGMPSVVSGVTYPNTYNFTVKVTDSQTPTAAVNTFITAITVNPALSLTPATLMPGTVNTGYSATVAATGGLTPYSYTLASGSLPDGLTLTTTTPQNGPAIGTISGTPTTAGTFIFTIEATDAVSETATAAFSITIVGKLEGNYVIYLNGFQNGQPFYMAGSFVADGNGRITSGLFDQTGPTGVITSALLFAGVYNIPKNSNFGTMTLNTQLGVYDFDILISTAGDSRVILADNNLYGSGLIKQQTISALPSNGGNFAFGLSGVDAGGNRYANAGALAINSALAVTGGEEDSNDNGTVSSQVSIIGGSLATPIDPNTGRGTATLTTAAGTTNYAFYVVSSSELEGVETDNAPRGQISILQQGAAGITGGGGSFTNGNLNGQAIMQLNALTGGSPDVSLGVATFDGAGNIARTDGLYGFFTDENSGGTLTQNGFNGTYNVDPSCGATLTTACGRVTVMGIGTNQPVWYLVSKNQGFVVGSDPSVTAGTFVQQTVPATGFSIGTILGSYLAATSQPVTSDVTNEIDVAVTPPPGGIWRMTYNSSGPAGLVTDQVFMEPYILGNIGNLLYGQALGRFIVQPTPPQVFVLYVLGSGASGVTGSKSGIVGLSLGTLAGTPEPNPKITVFGH
ncbi:MAG: Ig domain-containing protein [Candidatus Korobacteraceae bacterium]